MIKKYYIPFIKYAERSCRLRAFLAGMLMLVAGCADSNGGLKSMLAPSPTPAVVELQDAGDAAELPQPASSREGAGAALSSSGDKSGAIIGDKAPISRAMAAKMLALAFYSESYINTMDREISYKDTNQKMWYDKYINAVYIQGCMAGSGQSFEPEKPLTLEQVEIILAQLDPEKKIYFKAAEDKKANPISYALWVEFYQKLLEVMEVQDTRVLNFVVLASAGNNSKLQNWYMITDIGPYRHAGLNMDAYIDKRIQVIVKDDEVASLISVMDDAPIMKSVYVVNAGKENITVFSGGAERTYEFENSLENVSGQIADIWIDGGKALEVTLMSSNVGGQVMRTNNTEIELDNHAFLKDESFKAYSIADGPVKWKELKDIIVGTDMAVFTLKDGKAKAGVITKSVKPEKMRVVIQTTNYAGFVHENVLCTSDVPFTATTADTVKEFEAGEVFNAKDMPKTGRIFIIPSASDGKIEIKSISRNWPDGRNPQYAGIIEIGLEAYGYSIVNELPMEEYLYAVVPSEMPSSYGLEAAKVQAVTARSYAYNQFYENRFHQYGANVDDSVNCQVYNNLPPDDTSRKAVDQTKGKVLGYAGQVISANFFSTSAGVTANSGEVWASPAREFPTSSASYLKSQKQYTGKDYGDLSKEANAAAFFKAIDIESYDSGSPWFRWMVQMNAAELAASINANLKARYDAAPNQIKTLMESGVYRSRPIESIGELKDIEVTERGQGGNIMEMRLTGTKAAILVQTEYNIRALLSPVQHISGGNAIQITRQDGTAVENFNLLPSAFFTFDKVKNKDGSLEGIVFSGGGYGHGSGMSQNGVKGMIDKGFSFEEILTHYYPGAKVMSNES
ncbi:MAG: SpoIID/LytB domain-containing protein [Clostridiales bacterium]|nr:SpoIID/LytB domain-containing protein [Clostridiales bacterium]